MGISNSVSMIHNARFYELLSCATTDISIGHVTVCKVAFSLYSKHAHLCCGRFPLLTKLCNSRWPIKARVNSKEYKILDEAF